MSNPTRVSPASHWADIRSALQRIGDNSADAATLSQFVRALLGLELTSLVGPVVSALDLEHPTWPDERQSILRAVAALSPTSLVTNRCNQRFTDNILALTPGSPALADLRQLWEAKKNQFSFHQANDGNIQVLDHNARSVFAGMIGGLLDHRALADLWVAPELAYQLVRPFLFDSAGYGWVLQKVLLATERSCHNYSCAVYVVEPDPIAACILLTLHDFRPWSGRLRFSIGVESKQHLAVSLRTNGHWALPAHRIAERFQNRPESDLESVIASAAETREKERVRLRLDVDAWYSRYTAADWAHRFNAASAGRRTLRVLGITSRFTTVLQYSLEELADAVRAAGHEFQTCMEADDQSHEVPFVAAIAAFRPDLVVAISRLRYENTELPANVPFLCWDQDNLPSMRTAEAGRSLDALTFIAGYGARWGYERLGWPRRNCILAFQAAATHRYHNRPVDESLLQKHRCTFSYTSNASGSPESLLAEHLNYFQSVLAAKAVYERAAAELLPSARTGQVWDTVRAAQLLDAVLRTHPATIEAGIRSEMVIRLRQLSDRAFRHVALGWVADYCESRDKTLRLYGSGWENHPRFASYAAGFIKPGEELRAVYRASEVNLQIIETGFLHSRVLDGIAAGGFFLYRLAPEARDLDNSEQARVAMTRRAFETNCVTFGQLDASTDPIIVGPWAHARAVIPLGKPDEYCRMLDIWQAISSEEFQIPGLDQITFDGRAQFEILADRYLADPELRASVAASFRQNVVENHSYDTRWRQFLSGIATGLNESTNQAVGQTSQPGFAVAA